MSSPGSGNHTNAWRESRNVYICCGTMGAAILGILIWQLISLGFYDILSFYYGTLVILGYLSILFLLLSITRRRRKTIFRVLSLFLVILIGFPLIIRFFSQLFIVPPLLLFIAYYFFLFLLFIIFHAVGLIRIKLGT